MASLPSLSFPSSLSLPLSICLSIPSPLSLSLISLSHEKADIVSLKSAKHLQFIIFENFKRNRYQKNALLYFWSFWMNMLQSNTGCVSVCLCVVYVCVISAVFMWGYSCFRYNILPVRYMNKNTQALRVHSAILL